MKKGMFALLIFLPALFQFARAAGGDQCFTCHEGLGDKESAGYKHDIHFAKGITCAGCHGGNAKSEDMEKAMDKDAGYIGVPKGDDISRACAKCHSDSLKMSSYGATIPTNQWELLRTSVHARLATNGQEQIVQCITCHGVHGIVQVKSPASPVYPLNVVKTCSKCHADAAFMRSYNPSLPVDQEEKYRTSVHGQLNGKGDPRPAVCSSCHGSHNILAASDVKSRVYPVNIPHTCAECHSNPDYMKSYNIRTDQFAQFSRSVHGVELMEKHDVSAPACNSCHGNHGAAPPGVSSVSKVCGTCHALNADLFSASPHKKAFDEKHLPECETCHGNHEILAATDTLLGTSSGAVCSRCHTQTVSPKGFAVAGMMRALTDSLALDEHTAIALLSEAEQKGMEVSEAKFKLRDVHQARLQSRTVVHSASESQFRSTVDKGIAVAVGVIGEGRQAIDEYYFRRWGLGIATIIITIVALSLYLTIRRIERRQRTSTGTNFPMK